MSITRLVLTFVAAAFAAFLFTAVATCEEPAESESASEEAAPPVEKTDGGGSFPLFYYSGSNKSQYTNDIKGNKRKFENEFVLNAAFGDFSGYFRVSNDLSFPNKSKRTELEKVTLNWQGPGFDVTVGDFSTLFGHGLTLNAFEAPEIDYDTELTGAMVKVPLGDRGNAVAFKGNFKSAFMTTADDLQGADLDFMVAEGVTLGATYIEMDSFKGEVDGTQETDIFGVRGRFDFDNFNISGEYAEYNQNLTGPSYNDGTGWIIATGWHRNGLSIYGGYYEYEGIKSPYAVPATFKEHPEKGGVDGTDEIGYGTRITYSNDNAGNFDFNYSQSNHKKNGFPYTEAIFVWKPPSMERDTLVFENRYINELAGKENNTIVEWQRIVSSDWSSIVALEYSTLKSTIGNHDEHLISVAMDYLRQFTMIYKYELANFNFDTTNRWDLLTFRYQSPGYNCDVQLKYGGQRGGFSCAGGVCEFLPEFKGVEMTVNLYF